MKTFLPKNNLPVCCGFQTMLIRWCGYYGELDKIQSFTYVFPCDFARKSNEVDIYGTGGTMTGNDKLIIGHNQATGSLTHSAGAVNVLVGENGAGKSTMMKIIAGVEQPSEGRILILHGP